jgi:DNA-nicking Smr family endonuclease
MVKNKKKIKKTLDAQDVSKEDLELFLNAVSNLSDKEVARKLKADTRKSNRKSAVPSVPSDKEIKIDLHGYLVKDALELLRLRLSDVKRDRNQSVIKIVTGKGRHSEGGVGILVKEVYPSLYKEFSGDFNFIDPDPGKDLLNGVPLRGHFRIKLK